MPRWHRVGLWQLNIRSSRGTLEKVPYAGLTISKLLAWVSEPLFEIHARRLGFTIFPKTRLPEFCLPERASISNPKALPLPRGSTRVSGGGGMKSEKFHLLSPVSCLLTSVLPLLFPQQTTLALLASCFQCQPQKNQTLTRCLLAAIL